MFDIGIFAPFGGDHERNLAFCNDTAVRHIVLSVGNLELDDSGAPAAGPLKELVEHYRDHGVQLAGLTPPRIAQAAFDDSLVKAQELATMGRLLDRMGTAGIPYVHNYLNVDSIEDENQRPKLWDGLINFYRELIPLAENTGVSISTHTFHRPDRLLWNFETMSTLLNEVKSPNNGITFCQGKSQLAGDDLAANIIDYGDQITMFHIRDIVTQVEGPIAPEIEKRLIDMGYLEVEFGSGEVDMVGSFKALKEINYQGQIYPEHFPSIAGDSAAGLAMTIGYIRAMDQALAG
jgi:sugar phosphate isomerase/epimerase